MSEVMIQADGLVKIYKSKQTEVLALQGLDLTVEKGELTALIGNSGSGKSTFLNMIGGLDRRVPVHFWWMERICLPWGNGNWCVISVIPSDLSGRTMREICSHICQHWKILCFRCTFQVRRRKKKRHLNC